ncbi:MAG: hypothetical protein ACRELY_16565 [Polyangiaceae bacterium]
MSLACALFACGNAESPSQVSARTPVAASTASGSSTSSPPGDPSPVATADASAPTHATPAASANQAALCGSQPATCKPRIVETIPFCGPTAQWQMAQQGISPGDPRATRPVKACTCDRCASDADCTEKIPRSLHAEELAALGVAP